MAQDVKSGPVPEVAFITLLMPTTGHMSLANFPFICSNIPATPAYGVYVTQLKQCSAL
jgi:hypothetical protein